MADSGLLQDGLGYEGGHTVVSWGDTAVTGTITLYSHIDGIKARIPDGHITLGELDNDGQVRQQVLVYSKGLLSIESNLSGELEVGIL